MPVRPFVPALRTPVVQMMYYAPVPENFRHAVSWAAVFPWAATGRQVDVAARVLIEKPGIVLVGHVIHRVIEIEVVVVHPVHGIAQVVDAGERIAALYVVGMLEEGVGRVIGTERCAVGGDPDAWRLALGIDERNNFVRHIGVVLRLHPTSMEGVRALVCERIALHAVDAEDADSPLVDIRAESGDHALTFLLPFVAHAGGEGEDGCAVIAVNGDAHVPIETVRVPILMVTMHSLRG